MSRKRNKKRTPPSSSSPLAAPSAPAFPALAHANLPPKTAVAPGANVARPPSELAKKPDPREAKRASWLGASLGALSLLCALGLPAATEAFWVWPSRAEALLAAWAVALGAGIPLFSLLWAAARKGALGAWYRGAWIGALSSVHVACLLLWGGALMAAPLGPRAFGGEAVDRSCSEGRSCWVGLFDHGLNRHLTFGVKPADAASIPLGSERSQCMLPAWPSPARRRGSDPRVGCEPMAPRAASAKG